MNPTDRNLVPDRPSRAPDYFCTWNLQGYVTNCVTAQTRAVMTEASMFGQGVHEHWLDLFPAIRGDVTFVMDDSWDISIPDSFRKSTLPDSLYGSLILAEDRFPSFTGTPGARLEKLTQAVMEKGWRGLGGWICAQEAPALKGPGFQDYWSERLDWMGQSGFSYWKVDWGMECQNLEWRRKLSELARRRCPSLVVEHAMTPDAVTFSSAYRTYDVENINAVAPTVRRVCELLGYRNQGTGTGIINCEDEPYIAAGLGCAMGIMRHDFHGPFPDGRMDTCFPPVGRHIKFRQDEVTRGVRWHRIAEPFGVNADAILDPQVVTDTWRVQAGETWNKREPGSLYAESAPNRVSRNLPLAEVKVHPGQPMPFVLASRYPNGAIALASIGRTLERDYLPSPAAVSLAIGAPGSPIGLFGTFRKVSLLLDRNPGPLRILAQDLAGRTAFDITEHCSRLERSVEIPGDLIEKVGLASARRGDLSEPGLVLLMEPLGV